MNSSNLTIADEILRFLKSRKETSIIKVPKNTIVGFEGNICKSFNFLISGQIKVYKTSEKGKLLTLYNINSNEACILTSASIINDLPFPAMAKTISDCIVITMPAHYVEKYLDNSKLWRKFIFSMLLNKMAGLVSVVNDLAFHKLHERLLNWLQNNEKNGTVDITHQEIAEQLASTREEISRALKQIEKQGIIKLSRGKIKVM